MKAIFLFLLLCCSIHSNSQNIKLYIFVKPEDCAKFNGFNNSLNDNKNIVFVLPSIYKKNTVDLLNGFKKAEIIYSDKLFDQYAKNGFSMFCLSINKQPRVLNNTLYLPQYIEFLNDVLKTKESAITKSIDSLNKIGVGGNYMEMPNSKMVIFSNIDKFLKQGNKLFTYNDLFSYQLLLKYYNDSIKVKNQLNLFKQPLMLSFKRNEILCAVPYSKYTAVIGSMSVINTSYTPKGDTNYRMSQIFPIWFFDSVGKYQVSFLPGFESKAHSFDEGSIPYYYNISKQLRMSFLDTANNLVFGVLDTTMKFKFLKQLDSIKNYPKGVHQNGIVFTNSIAMYGSYPGYINFNTGKVVHLNLRENNDKGLVDLLNSPSNSYEWNGAVPLGGFTKILLTTLQNDNKFKHYIIYFENETGNILYSKSFEEMKSKYTEKTPYLNPYTNKIYCIKIAEGKVKIISFKE